MNLGCGEFGSRGCGKMPVSFFLVDRSFRSFEAGFWGLELGSFGVCFFDIFLASGEGLFGTRISCVIKRVTKVHG